MQLRTKDAIKSDYKELMDRIDIRLKELKTDMRGRKDDVKASTREKFNELEKYQKELRSKYTQLESTAEDSMSHIVESVESTYNEALNNLSRWLKDAKTKN